MLASISEGVLLERARTEGLLTAADIESAQKERGRHSIARKWGPVLDLLIAQGKISDEALRKLQASLLEPSAAAQPALDQTMDGGLEHTMQSEAGAQVVPKIQLSHSYPAPHWDKYEFLETLGRGGMGAVYRARDRRLGRLVALKFIHGDDPGMIQRFLQEARAQARLDHPFICKVYEVGSVDNKPYIAMELVEGMTLDRASAGLDLSQKLQLLKDSAEALHAAHQQGIIHRDIKPSNIMVERTASGGLRPVIMDFGLARESGDSHGLTESGAVMGTPAYMSPEQARGEARRLDRRSDVYSLGATLYDVLSGKPPFEDQTVLNILLKVMNEAATPLRQLRPEIPEAVELVVSKCLNKEPAQRYQTAQELADDLGRILSSQKVAARRLSYSYRLSYWAKNNRTLAALTAALLCSVIVGSGYGIRARWVAIQKERRAKEQAELSRWIGQNVKDLEWVARTAYLLPLHDTRYEKELVQQRMAEIETELARHPDIGPKLLAYARGRGLLSLHKWKEASAELRRAEQLGYVDLELCFAQGRALGALYSEALDEARKSGDKSFFEKRKAELDIELLRPALSYLERSKGLRTVSSTYVEGLIAYYQEQHDVALARAEEAHKKAPWLYEAVQLSGDVFLARARSQRDRGEHDPAEKSFTEAVARYKQAADIGRSDHSVYEAIAEAYIRWEELDYFRGRNPEPQLKEALAAADKALLAAPKESHGHTKKAFAYDFMAQHTQRVGPPPRSKPFRLQQLAEATEAIRLTASDAYAYESAGIAKLRLAELETTDHEQAGNQLQESYAYFLSALQINPRFPWAFNDHAIALLAEAKQRQQLNQSPLDLIQQSVQLAEKALALDPSYIYALNTVTAASLRACTWQMEHGQHPGLWAARGVSAAERALSLNRNYGFAYGNIGSIYMNLALYELMAGTDLMESHRLAVDAWQTMAKIRGPSAEISSFLGILHSFSALQKIERQIDPSAAIVDGMQTISGCVTPPGVDSYCQDVQARLHALQADWQQRKGIPAGALLTQAYDESRRVLRTIPDEPDALLSNAEIALQVLRSRALSGRKQQQLFAEASQSLDRALLAAPGWPRALAVQGALLATQSHQEATLATKQTLERKAQECLRLALAGNPLLKRKYGAMLEDVERRLGTQANE